MSVFFWVWSNQNSGLANHLVVSLLMKMLGGIWVSQRSYPSSSYLRALFGRINHGSNKPKILDIPGECTRARRGVRINYFFLAGTKRKYRHANMRIGNNVVQAPQGTNTSSKVECRTRSWYWLLWLELSSSTRWYPARCCENFLNKISRWNVKVVTPKILHANIRL
jgi:hypothetical protein